MEAEEETTAAAAEVEVEAEAEDGTELPPHIPAPKNTITMGISGT